MSIFDRFKPQYDPALIVPAEIVRQAHAVKAFLATNEAESVCGLGDVDELRRQLVDVTRERDQLYAALKVADALRNHERGMAGGPLERRTWRRK